MLQRTVKKEPAVTPTGIRFLSVHNDNRVSYDMIMLLGLCSIWRSRMAFRHADLNAKEVRTYILFKRVLEPGA